MTIARVHSWVAGEVLTASDLNSEFNNLVNAGIALVTPLTAGLSMGNFRLTDLSAGSASTPSLSFDSDSNTGIYSSAQDSIDLTARGLRVLQASGYEDAVNWWRFVPSKTGQALSLEAAGTDANIGISLVPKGTGYVEATAFRFGVFTATQTADVEGRAYWHKTEGTLHIVAGSLMGRVPAITSLQAGDLIFARNPTGVAGATTYDRLGIGDTGQVLGVSGGLPAYTTPSGGITAWAKFNGSNGSILASAGVSKVARESSGVYRVDWTTPFASTNYAVTAIAGGGAQEVYVKMETGGTPYLTTGAFISVHDQNGTLQDAPSVNIMAIGAT